MEFILNAQIRSPTCYSVAATSKLVRYQFEHSLVNSISL